MKTRIWNTNNLVIVFLGFSAGLLFVSTAVIHAATFNIANGDVAGLKNAINAANSNGVPDTINLAVNGTYTLTTVDNTLGGRNGLPVVEKDLSDPQVDLVINGNGATIARGGGADLFRLLHIRGGAICTINNLKFYNGLGYNEDDTGPGGGALFNNASQVTVSGCRFDSGFFLGAPGVYNGNTCHGRSAHGGAIYSTGVLAVSSSTFINNGTAGGQGEHCFSGDSAGGAISSSTDTVAVTNCTFTNNYSNSDDSSGGAIASVGGSFADSTLVGNTAAYGGAVISRGTAILRNCSMNNNTAGESGGAVFADSENITLTSCTFNGNKAGHNGGALFSSTSTTIADCIFDGNQTTDLDAQSAEIEGGGAIYYSGDALTSNKELQVTNTRLENNRAGYNGGDGRTNGGAICLNMSWSYDEMSLKTVLSYCTISGNHAYRGGGIYFCKRRKHSTTVVVTDSTISGNYAGAFGAGGGIYSISLDGVAEDDNGQANLSLTNCTLSGNHVDPSGTGGAGLSNQAGTVGGISNVVITNCTFSGNDAPSGDGGAISNISNFQFAGEASASISLHNTILNAGSSGENIFNSNTATATITSLGHNISSDAAGGNTGTGPGGLLNGAGDKRNTNPMIAPLAANGGPTQTHALNAGSPAINAGTGSQPDHDQRSYLRSGAIDIGAFEFAGSLAPVSVGSFKTQGGNLYGVDLPVTGTPGLECRSGGPNGNHTLSLQFGTPVTVGGANVTSGVGATNGVLVNGSHVSVLLTNVVNAQQITVTLANVSDGTHTNNVIIPARFLLGDTTGDSVVNSADIAQTKSKSGQGVGATNFRNDVNADGLINSGDISLVKSKSGTATP